MRKVIFKTFVTFVSLKKLDGRLQQQWDEGQDAKGAIRTAQKFYGVLTLKAQSIDVSADYWRVSHAAEVLWDSGCLKDAVLLVRRWREVVEEVCDRNKVDWTEPRTWALILTARLEHRRRNYKEALQYARMAMTEIKALAGGEKALRTSLKNGEQTDKVELYCAALAIAIPAGRLHLAGKPALRNQLLESWIADAKEILDREHPPELVRAHALTIQLFYAIAEGPRNAESEAWIEHLIPFDDLLRPRHWRGQATKRLRDVALARFKKRATDEIAAARLAREDLDRLKRHIEVLDANGWWRKASSDD